MKERDIAELASGYARDIVVAKVPSTQFSTNAGTGKAVADFYVEIYKGIYTALKEDLLTEGTKQIVRG